MTGEGVDRAGDSDVVTGSGGVVVEGTGNGMPPTRIKRVIE